MFSIVVVDDEKSVREGLQKYLQRQEGLFDEVYSATNGQEALQLLEEKSPQIIITDINMPHMDGLEFIEFLRLRRQDITIIVLSGYDDFSYAQRAMRSGVEYYLLKPVNRKELIEILQKIKTEYFQKLKAQEEIRELKRWYEENHTGDSIHLESEKTVEDDKKSSMVQQQDIAERALKLIQTKWNDPRLTLNEIASELYVSHNYLRFLIKEKTGMSFVKYVNDIRLERAADILSTTDRKVQEVALDVGFEDAGYFTRIFTKKYLCSPSKYRDNFIK